MFHLIPGNPQQQPATSTRFVLPFAYRLGISENPPDAPYFCELADNPNLKWRKQYLTTETAKVLFERARWFGLQNLPQEYARLTLGLRKGPVEVALNPPRLVLFEYPKEPDFHGDILRTGFLLLDLYFPDGTTPRFADLLEINELFRYWREPYAGHREERKPSGGPGSGYQRLMQNWPLPGGKTIHDAQANEDIYTRRWTDFLRYPVKDGHGRWLSLFVEDAKDWRVHADDRTYVWTCALTENGGTDLRDTFHPKAEELDAVDYGHWIKLLNIDAPGETPGSTHYARRFEREWATPLSYRRWQEYGTFYGFTPHSGAMLAERRGEPPLWRHFGQMYFDQVLLLLYVRTSLFRFSEQLTEISAQARDSTHQAKDTAWLDGFGKLREAFVWFTNLYQFPLLSNQQQAVEMYGLAREAMDINELFAEVEREIHGSHDYLSLQTQLRQTEMSTVLTVVATMGAGAALAGTYWALDWIKDWGWPVVLGVSFLYILLGVWIAKPLSGWFERLYKNGWRIFGRFLG